MCLRLFKFPGRPFDPSDIIKNFTIAVKIKVFSKEYDLLMICFNRKVHLNKFFIRPKCDFLQQNFKSSKCIEKEG